jgi:hypothetical protein
MWTRESQLSQLLAIFNMISKISTPSKSNTVMQFALMSNSKARITDKKKRL